jgi:hypothetical protein
MTIDIAVLEADIRSKLEPEVREELGEALASLPGLLRPHIVNALTDVFFKLAVKFTEALLMKLPGCQA